MMKTNSKVVGFAKKPVSNYLEFENLSKTTEIAHMFILMRSLFSNEK